MEADRLRLPFKDRAAAGEVLAEVLEELKLQNPVVLALPRGGVAVAAPVARGLEAPLDVLVTRKIGHPGHEELGVGAIAEGGEPVFDHGMLRRVGLSEDDLDDVVAEEKAELARRVAVYRGGRPLPDLRGRDVVVVDDGLATGGTARAALRAVRGLGAERVVLAVPVAAVSTAAAMRAEADDVVVLAKPWDFQAVGQWYQRFDQLTDAEVLGALGHAE